jgi:2-phosphosulfolactate phosphatase
MLTERCDVLVLVDVLSFTTSLTIALTRSAVVWPHPWRDGAEELARELGATVARGRSTREGPTLSPASLVDLEHGTRLVMPSPNGSGIAHAAVLGATPMVGASLRNASAVARHLMSYERVGLVPAGERWPDESLRPAYEDLVGAGAIATRLGGDLSPDAQAAALAFASLRPLEQCPSGAELVERGFAEDVRLASEVDVEHVVPVLKHGKFVAV